MSEQQNQQTTSQEPQVHNPQAPKDDVKEASPCCGGCGGSGH